ncbi:MAG: Nif3-like dinuclear metal center hexameric protein [Firmicutes bacterium]|nr:Nif3-like dinuclear metal center hexameric protein [Bacillota bacterium]
MLLNNEVSARYLYERLEELFKPERCTDVFPKKGLQEHNSDVVRKVYTACFASPEVFDNIFERDERNVMLFTHHPSPAKKSLAQEYAVLPQRYFDEMKERGINFFSYHIPMDAYGPYSTGVSLSRAMGCEPYDSWYPQNGINIGCLNQSCLHTTGELRRVLEAAVGHRCALYQYGSEELPDGRFAIMTGAAKSTEAYQWLTDLGINTFVLGVTSPTVDFTMKIHEAAKAKHINLIGGTHYSTEKFAPMAMCRYFRHLGLDSEFIPEQPVMSEI